MNISNSKSPRNTRTLDPSPALSPGPHWLHTDEPEGVEGVLRGLLEGLTGSDDEGRPSREARELWSLHEHEVSTATRDLHGCPSSIPCAHTREGLPAAAGRGYGICLWVRSPPLWTRTWDEARHSPPCSQSLTWPQAEACCLCEGRRKPARPLEADSGPNPLAIDIGSGALLAPQFPRGDHAEGSHWARPWKTLHFTSDDARIQGGCGSPGKGAAQETGRSRLEHHQSLQHHSRKLYPKTAGYI